MRTSSFQIIRTLLCVFKRYKSEIFVVWLGIRKFVSLLDWVIKKVFIKFVGQNIFFNVKKRFSSAPAINNDYSLISVTMATLIGYFTRTFFFTESQILYCLAKAKDLHLKNYLLSLLLNFVTR